MGKKIVDETLKFEVIINGDKAKKEYGLLDRAKKKLVDRNDELEKQAKKLERSRKDNKEAIKKLRDEIEKNNKTIQSNESRMKQLTKEIGLNNLSMRDLGKEARRLSGIMSNLDPESPKWAELNKELKAVKGRMSELREEMRPVQSSMEDNIDLLGNMTAGLGQFLIALNSGDAKAAKAAILGIMESLKGATKAGIAFIATPIGATIAALAGIGLLAKEWFNYNEGAKEAIMLTEQITGLQDESANSARLQAEAISDTFNVDFIETLKTAKALSEQFNISFTEALDEVRAGLINGQKTNDEYFDSLREYPTFFASADFSAKEFRKTIETGYDLSIYSDKLPDAIKEVDLSLREQTESTKEALKNAFGAAFTEDLLRRIRQGETSTKQALKEISAEAEKTGLNVQQNAQLTADLFRGAGEDAGGAAKVLMAFNMALNETDEALSPLEQRLKDVSDANERFAKAQDAALKSDRYVAYTNDLKIFWIDVKTQFFKGVKFVVDLWTRWDERMQTFLAQFITTLSVLPTVAKSAFSKMKDEVWDVVKTFSGLGDVLENLMSFKFDAAKESFNKFKRNFKNEVGDVKGVAVDAIKQVNEARKIAGDYVSKKFQEKRDAAAQESGLGTIPQGSTPLGGKGGGEQELTPEDKKRLESRKRLAELLNQFETERKLQEDLKKVEKEKRAEEEEILRIEQKFQKLSEQAQGETELLARLEEEKQAQIQDVRNKYGDIQIAKNEEIRKQLLADSKKFNEQLLQSESKLEAGKAQLKQQGLNILKRVVGESSVLGKAIFAIEKGLAISSIVTQTAKANAAVMANLAIANTKAMAASPLTFGQPFVGANTTTALASIATNNAASKLNIATIVAETVAGIAGFEKGLYPIKRNDGRTFQSRFGGEPTTQVVTAPTHFIAGEAKPEMIIDGDTFKKMDPAITDYILALSGRLPVFQNGMYPKNENDGKTMEMLSASLAKLNERLSEPIYSYTVYDNEASIKQQEFDEKIRKVRNNAKIKNNAS
jgi:DNA repair exonuclease SbcCD ATPase subunit